MRHLLVAVVFGVVTSTGSSSPAPPTSSAAASGTSRGTAPSTEAASPYDGRPSAVRAQLERPFTRDVDQQAKRRLIRAGVVLNRTQYFMDRGPQRGMVYVSLRLFEEQLHKRVKTGELKVHVAFVPLNRDQLFPALVEG